MSTVSTSGPSERAAATRERILEAAERLFAEHGVHAVSNRAVAEAAGQGNNTVVGYHFGTKADLVRALIRRQAGAMDARREETAARLPPEADLRDWVDALVRPVADHLAAAGAPTWYARFGAQVMTDPALREIMVAESLASRSLTVVLDGLNARLPTLPPEVRLERGEICRQLLVHHFAERERALAEGLPTPRSSWADAATGLVDVLVGVWTAPVSPAGPGA
ncbi:MULTISPECIES: TetR/AcrR family transcriptional regulator [unclassified Pseudonocardia]|uniref:TetR/AcrR family transcriptional regulator n=1 Tax=unclassified Pseudonocardia TaxID=2619320 RepID=UPI0001FFEE12|nr:MULTISPECIES: TetR/AcrR family transcriptional regulator [unclassified Pseudonocardia]ALE74192.1 TetR family transcriptional regulator [Pseudonocardia sp. EC080625-04]ALL77606.1 TetR family transcriptional regulator [Pseudonocardia sp. EC080610-09]ALL80522.1 TetR family transcriptional regulator [Pseudonocardia sp. EC080619-01]OLM17637.1 Transcriptional regulator, TetR family [Pseudonocardia sp. Ae707_Ps1]